MPIVLPNAPITAARNEEMIRQLAQRYPFIRTQMLGRSAFGRPIPALIIGNGPRKVLYTAAHHANEWITSYLLLQFAEELAEAIETGGRVYGVPAATIGNAATIFLVPMVDPDGVDLVTGAIAPGSLEYEIGRQLSAFYPAIPFPDGWKANLMGVDLNLNYPAGWLQARQIKFDQGFTRPAPRDYVGRAPLTQLEPRAQRTARSRREALVMLRPFLPKYSISSALRPAFRRPPMTAMVAGTAPLRSWRG